VDARSNQIAKEERQVRAQSVDNSVGKCGGCGWCGTIRTRVARTRSQKRQLYRCRRGVCGQSRGGECGQCGGGSVWNTKYLSQIRRRRRVSVVWGQKCGRECGGVEGGEVWNARDNPSNQIGRAMHGATGVWAKGGTRGVGSVGRGVEGEAWNVS
jgi:hypothetical protein